MEKGDGSNSIINKENLIKAIDFLKRIWFYTSLDAKCYSVIIMDSRVEYRHFCLDDVENYIDLFKQVEEYLARKLDPGKHVYFQILPLSSKPKRGRGSEKDVKVGKWLWIDFDYKNIVETPEFEGCRELDDYALECYYLEGDKWIHVSRPPLSQVLNHVRTMLEIEPSLIVDSGAGYHVYFKLMYEIDAGKLKKLESKLVDALGGDPQTKDLARILRLPGSINPRVNRLVKVIYDSGSEIDPDTLESKLVSKPKVELERIAKPRETPVSFRELRELGDGEILRIVDMLKDAYKPGSRQFLCLYLSGWLAKARVSPLTAVKIIKLLYDNTQDTDPLKTRLSAVVYSYKKAGINIDAYSSDIETLTGVKPYGLEREIDESTIKGVTGLQEILESTLGEERALSIIHELSEILQCLSP
ncbi:MAG: hypothetical protein QW607_11375 [Desulfurococcaceae archaeon]